MNLKKKIASVFVDKKGYSYFRLCKDNKQKRYAVHQLVAMAFIGFEPCGYSLIINHIDGNPQNNYCDNLQITTQRDNLTNCFRKDRARKQSKYSGVCCSGSGSKKWRATIHVNNKNYHLGSYKTEEEAFIAYNTAKQKI